MLRRRNCADCETGRKRASERARHLSIFLPRRLSGWPLQRERQCPSCRGDNRLSGQSDDLLGSSGSCAATLMTARFMRQDFFDFVPTFKLFVAGRHRLDDQEERATLRRLPGQADAQETCRQVTWRQEAREK